MKLVIQRVKNAAVAIEGEITGKIQHGFLVFIGIGQKDTPEIADLYLVKMLKLRIFPDENGKTNRAIKDVNGELLLVSQFTLYADCKKGNRPSFTGAGNPKTAKKIYDYFVTRCQEEIEVVKTGRFGAEMEVSLVNDGPFTIVLENIAC